MISLQRTTVEAFALCDVALLGLNWLEGGRDLQLRIVLADGRRARLTCVWVSGLTIELRYEGDWTGWALSWECRFAEAGGRWHMEFEFPPQGKVALDCNEAQLEVEATE